MREVEIRVRELSGAGTAPGDLGVKLVQREFGEGGALADPRAEGGERQATMALFWGALGVFKNPSSHREVEFDDPTEAAEVVMLADLLLRVLERVAARLWRSLGLGRLVRYSPSAVSCCLTAGVEGQCASATPSHTTTRETTNTAASRARRWGTRMCQRTSAPASVTRPSLTWSWG